MRLIDADRLLEQIDAERKYLIKRGQIGAEHILVHNFRDLVLNTPTVETSQERIMAYKNGYEQGRFDEMVETELSLPRWILCSERLPDNGDIVIVSIRDETGDTKFNYSSCGWVTTDKEYWIVDNEINNYVVAWMPLPNAYEEKENG